MNVLILTAALLCGQDQDPRFKDVEIEKPFDSYLLAHPLLMDVAGAKIVKLSDGKILVVGVAYTPIRDNSPADRRRRDTVCKNRALANILGEKKNVLIAHVEKVEKKDVVVIDKQGKASDQRVSEYFEMTQSKLEGVVRDFPVVGRWKSGDGKLYYLAIGAVLDAKGERVTDEQK
jgi:hypothetical protein